jgi:hypothetical protein
MREGLPEKLRPSIGRNPEEARMQIYTGLDLSRKRLDWHACRGDGTLVGAGAVPPDPDGLAKLVHRLDEADVLAVVESMNGARFIHDRLELAGWDVRLADPLRARALAPLACKTDRIDCWVLAELARRDLIPEVWLPDPDVRAERERARFRLHLVKHRTMLKNRIHQTLIAHGHARARRADRRARTRAAPARRRPPLRAALAHRPRDRLGARVHDRLRDRRDQPLPKPTQADRLHRPLPARLPVRRTRPPRTAHQKRTRLPLLGAGRSRAHNAARHPLYRQLAERQRRRHRQRGSAIATITIARKLTEAIWWMLTRNQPFAPAGARSA